MTRDEAWNLLNAFTKSESLIKHALAVEAAMLHYAAHFGHRVGLCASGKADRHDREQREEKDETEVVRRGGETRRHRERRTITRPAARRTHHARHRRDADRGRTVGVCVATDVSPQEAIPHQ